MSIARFLASVGNVWSISEQERNSGSVILSDTLIYDLFTILTAQIREMTLFQECWMGKCSHQTAATFCKFIANIWSTEAVTD